METMTQKSDDVLAIRAIVAAGLAVTLRPRPSRASRTASMLSSCVTSRRGARSIPRAFEGAIALFNPATSEFLCDLTTADSDGGPVVSPDAKQPAFTRNDDLYVVKVWAGGEAEAPATRRTGPHVGPRAGRQRSQRDATVTWIAPGSRTQAIMCSAVRRSSTNWKASAWARLR
jgi:hypothetical protein